MWVELLKSREWPADGQQNRGTKRPLASVESPTEPGRPPKRTSLQLKSALKSPTKSTLLPHPKTPPPTAGPSTPKDKGSWLKLSSSDERRQNSFFGRRKLVSPLKIRKLHVRSRSEKSGPSQPGTARLQPLYTDRVPSNPSTPSGKTSGEACIQPDTPVYQAPEGLDSIQAAFAGRADSVNTRSSNGARKDYAELLDAVQREEKKRSLKDFAEQLRKQFSTAAPPPTPPKDPVPHAAMPPPKRPLDGAGTARPVQTAVPRMQTQMGSGRKTQHAGDEVIPLEAQERILQNLRGADVDGATQEMATNFVQALRDLVNGAMRDDTLKGGRSTRAPPASAGHQPRPSQVFVPVTNGSSPAKKPRQHASVDCTCPECLPQPAMPTVGSASDTSYEPPPPLPANPFAQPPNPPFSPWQPYTPAQAFAKPQPGAPASHVLPKRAITAALVNMIDDHLLQLEAEASNKHAAAMTELQQLSTRIQHVQAELTRTEEQRDAAGWELTQTRGLYEQLQVVNEASKAECASLRTQLDNAEPSEEVKRRIARLEADVRGLQREKAAGELRMRDLDGAKRAADRKVQELERRCEEAEFSQKALREEGVRMMRELERKDRQIEDMERAHKRVLNRI